MHSKLQSYSKDCEFSQILSLHCPFNPIVDFGIKNRVWANHSWPPHKRGLRFLRESNLQQSGWLIFVSFFFFQKKFFFFNLLFEMMGPQMLVPKGIGTSIFVLIQKPFYGTSYLRSIFNLPMKRSTMRPRFSGLIGNDFSAKN